MKYLLLIAFISSAEAQPVLFTLEAPTQRADNTPLTYQEIDKYKVYVDGLFVQDASKWAGFIPGKGMGLFVNLPLDDGTYIINFTTLDTGGRESVFSPDLTVIVDSIAPPQAMACPSLV